MNKCMFQGSGVWGKEREMKEREMRESWAVIEGLGLDIFFWCGILRYAKFCRFYKIRS